MKFTVGDKVIYVGTHCQQAGEVYDVKEGRVFFHSYGDPYLSGWVTPEKLTKERDAATREGGGD